MKSFLAACLLLVSPAFAGGLLFSQMEDGDKVQVTESSTGCFHNTVSYYEVARKDAAYSFAIFKISWSEGAPPRKILKQEEVGRMPLSKDDVRRLDGMLKFYRGPKYSSSTTELSLVLEFKQADGLVMKEKIHDHSGGPYSEDEQKNAATFEEMALRLKRLIQGGEEQPAK